MASFCYQCTEELFGEEHSKENDFVGLARHNERHHCLCEGCGWITVDKHGKKVEEDA
jgi:hypothetical protein